MPNVSASRSAPHLLVALSPHGYGHAAMTGPVVAALSRIVPDLRLTLQTPLPAEWLRPRYGADFRIVPEIPDFGLRQSSATEVLVEDSAAAYRDLHARLDAAVAHEARQLTTLKVDLVLSNVAYVPILAARRAGLPALALSCLNWADIYRHFFRGRPEAPGIEAQMRAAYAAADQFLQTAPAMPMDWLPNLRPIGPVARKGRADRDRLRRLLGLEGAERVGLIAFGGFAPGRSLADWPRLPGWRWVTTADPAGHPDMVAADRVAMEFGDLLASCDLVVTKPGYGTFTEAAVDGIPVLYVPRRDWPEAPYLVEWLERQGRCLALDPALPPDALGDAIDALLSLPAKPPVEPTGNRQAAEIIAAALARTGQDRKG